MSDIEILTEAIKVFGEEKQERKAIEELSELIVAISHKHFDREHNIAEEIADVEVMLEQLKIINRCYKEVEDIKKVKIERLYDKVCDECF